MKNSEETQTHIDPRSLEKGDVMSMIANYVVASSDVVQHVKRYLTTLGLALRGLKNLCTRMRRSFHQHTTTTRVAICADAIRYEHSRQLRSAMIKSDD
jgi:hypothetical protein